MDELNQWIVIDLLEHSKSRLIPLKLTRSWEEAISVIKKHCQLTDCLFEELQQTEHNEQGNKDVRFKSPDGNYVFRAYETVI